jgi:organic radical activating enzyme
MSQELSNWRDENLNNISKSFCAAKWYNVSLHLGHGFKNSCHLPLPHPIDVNEIKNNPSALHNTKLTKEMRKMMLTGVRPAECSYCWKIEDIGRNNIADRVYKSIIYQKEDIAKLKDHPWDQDIMPKTIEVSFDRACNFACSYCNAGYSTTWGKDIKKNGPYQKFKTTSAGAYYADGSWSEIYGKYNEKNPYVKAFLEWWPELSQNLEEIRVTGGEPSQSRNFWQFIDLMKQYPSDKLRLAVNSNLGLSDELLDKLIAISHELPIKEFDLYTSNESYGKHADYIRDGLNYDKWRSNMVKFIENAKFRSLTIMMTINSLCLFSITEFLDDMITLKEKYGMNRPNVDFNILRWPAFMSPLALPDDVKIELREKLNNWYQRNINSELFSIHEKAQVQRLIDYIEVVNRGHNTTELEKELQFHDFKSFYQQYDKRRGKNFVETFPQLKNWYESIIVDNNIPDVKMTDGRITHFETGVYESDVKNYNKQ